MKLVLGAGAYCNWVEAIEVLTALGFKERQARATRLNASIQPEWRDALATQNSILIEDSSQLALVSELLLQYPDRRVVLFYADLPLALTNIFVQSNGDIKQSLTIWEQNLQDLQSFYRQNREQVLLFDIQQVLQYPQQFLEVCATEWQCEPVLSLPIESMQIQPDPVVMLLAQQLIEQDSGLAKQLQYIKAMTWPLGAESVAVMPTLDMLLDYAETYYGFQSQLAQLAVEHQKLTTDFEAQHNELRQENKLVLEQLLVVQEELEAKIVAEQQLTKEIEALNTVQKNAQSQWDTERVALVKKESESNQTTDLQVQQQELTLENQLILEQLLVVQEELEKRIVAREELSKENALLLKQLHKTQEQLEQRYKIETQLKEKSKIKAAKLAVLENEKAQLAEQFQHVVDINLTDLRSRKFANKTASGSYFERQAAKKAQRLASRKDKERAEQIAKSTWFDAAWYLEQYPDVAADSAQSVNPALHYMRMGGFEGRNPSPYFDSEYYLSMNPDVVLVGMNPLWHFLQNGQAEGRKALP